MSSEILRRKAFAAHLHSLDTIERINPCPPELIKLPLSLLVFSLSDFLIRIIAINSST